MDLKFHLHKMQKIDTINSCLLNNENTMSRVINDIYSTH